MRRITNVRIPSPRTSTSENNLWWVLLDDQEVVIAINPLQPDSGVAGEDWSGDWLSPMAVDLQINGGLGISFPELTLAELPKLLDLLDQLWLDGVEAICPTFVSCGVDQLREALYVLHEARKKPQRDRCELFGSHLEGPFLAPGRHGAHAIDFLCQPSISALEERITGFEDEIALVTLAPELTGSGDLIKRLRTLGIIVALGHSAADETTCSWAFDNGVSMITHIFNAMPGLNHRSPGAVGQAIANGDIAMSLIADGVHVHPTIALMMQKISADQLVIVSDALAPYGLKDGKYSWDKREMFVEKGTCRLKDGTLVGVSLSILEGCRRLVQWGGDPSAAIWSATIAPRVVLGGAVENQNHLVGKSFGQLLRWHCNFDDSLLNWRRAA